jgi:hypothetical protein
MEQSSLECNSCPATQEITCLLWNPKVWVHRLVGYLNAITIARFIDDTGNKNKDNS